ncbi:hypothetical protein MP228_007969 [Amoeboaphelidium protococcarum]|nr:hypothetical protein MP228_007969 [Amoeboaphelidium protococcarum]
MNGEEMEYLKALAVKKEYAQLTKAGNVVAADALYQKYERLLKSSSAPFTFDNSQMVMHLKNCPGLRQEQQFRHSLDQAAIKKTYVLLEVAYGVIYMARSSSDPLPATSLWVSNASQSVDKLAQAIRWDLECFVKVVRDRFGSINWDDVIALLDVPEFQVSDLRAFEVIVQVYAIAAGPAQPFPFRLFCEMKWLNMKGQTSFLRMATQAPKSLFDVVKLSENPVLDNKDLDAVPAATKNIVSSWLTQPWNSLDLITILMNLACAEVTDDAKQLLDVASRQSTELVVIGLVKIKQDWHPLHLEVVKKLVSIFIIGHSSSAFVLNVVWNLKPQLVVDLMVDLYTQDSMILSRVLDIVQEIKALPQLLEVVQADNVQPGRIQFKIELAIMASRREYLNLEKWVVSQGKFPAGQVFVQSLLKVLKQKLESASSTQQKDSSISALSEDICVHLFTALEQLDLKDDKGGSAVGQLYKEVKAIAVKVCPKLSELVGASAVDQSSFSPDVEEKANQYYEKIYGESMSINAVIDLLSGFKSSTVEKEKQIFDCMIHNLFDEYRFFPKYPDKELLITAELLGKLVNKQLLSPNRLGLALRYVLESLRRPAGSKMFKFAVCALRQYQSRLGEWPQYCNHLLQISTFVDSCPDLAQAIKVALSKPPVQQQEVKKPKTSGSQESLLKSADSLNAPDQATQEKILFVVNNLSIDNMDEKSKDLRQLLSEESYSWFINYLIVKRVSTEPNFHPLYWQVVDNLKSPQLSKRVLDETYANIKVLLNSQKTVTSSQERTLLKNLGSWLGMVTIAKNKPILSTQLNLKELILSGYKSQRLIVTIPFVCKVLEHCKNSRVYVPPNPWLMSILRLLVELYNNADLKLNLKFEIEVLCKSVDVELKDIEPSSVLFPPGSRPLSYADSANIGFDQLSIQDNMSAVSSNFIAPGTQLTCPVVVYDDHGNVSIPDLAQYVSFSGNAPLFNAHPALKKLVVSAVDRAIKEVLVPVVERSVSIAVIATRDLITKDFASEGNEDRLKRAAVLMVQNLSGNLALVTCKDPFMKCLNQNLRSALQQSGIGDPMIDMILASITPENGELGCQIIQKASMDKSIPSILESLNLAFLARRRQRERGMPWSELPQNIPAKFIGLSAAPLQNAQNVYESFASNGSIQVPPALSGVQSAQVVSSMQQQQQQPQTGGVVPMMSNPVPSDLIDDLPSANPLQQIMDKISALLDELDKIVKQNANVSLSSLPSDHEIITLVRQINVAASQFFVRDELALWFSQKLVSLLFKTEIVLGIEIYIVLLERICELSRTVATEFTTWLFFSEEEIKLKVPINIALIQSGLLNILEYDGVIAKFILSKEASKISFAIRLIHQCLFTNPPIVTHAEFYTSLVALAQVTQAGGDSILLDGDTRLMLDEIKLKAQSIFYIQSDEYLERKVRFVEVFQKWNMVSESGSQNWNQLPKDFRSSLEQLNVLRDDNEFLSMLRTCLEYSVQQFNQFSEVQGVGHVYLSQMDLVAKFIFFVLRQYSAAATVAQEEVMFSKTIATVVMVLVNDYQLHQKSFNQKPYFRLFASVMNLLHHQHFSDKLSVIKCLTIISNSLHTLNPSRIASFAFAWLELVSHRQFMPFMLEEDASQQEPQQQIQNSGWKSYFVLLMDLFQFLSPFLRHAEMTDPIRLLYKGSLRILLVLLHDVPEFLCQYFFQFCNVIPPSCIQLRNLILSAFPRSMLLPDPFTPNLKIEALPEIQIQPPLAVDHDVQLREKQLLEPINSYLSGSGSAEEFAKSVKQRLVLSSQEVFLHGTNYNIQLINAVVYHVGVDAILSQASGVEKKYSVKSLNFQLMKALVLDIDTEGRYHVLNAIANQLRYPNAHTYYFSVLLLTLFHESSSDIVKEQITRVLLERLIVNRPHPWGILITFIELLKNQKYNFWSHAFTRCAPDIERLFESVARSCMLPHAGSGRDLNNNAAASGDGNVNK